MKIRQTNIIDGEEKVNRGKNYKDYLKEYKKKTRGDRRKIMKQARDTIKRIRSSKEYVSNTHIKDYDFDFF
jgi:vacuolar-type H+-ATPase subunit H